MKHLVLIGILSLGSFAFAGERISNDIVSIYATYQQKNTHDNITINYLAYKKNEKAPVLYVSEEPGIDPDEHKGLRHEHGKRIDLPKIDNVFVYSTEVEGLKANTVYYFVTGDSKNGYSPEMSFKTLPTDNTPITIVQGGDMGYDSDISVVPESAMENEPDVILIGGDIAYADGKAEKFNRWIGWFSFMNKVMISPELRVIPLIVAVGNHESKGLLGSNKTKIPYYYRLFPQNGFRAFFSRKLGANSVLIVLDTGHGHNPGGKQKEWMKDELQSEIETTNKLALYHIPMYPAHRGYNSFPSSLMRNTWKKYFDRYGLTLAFENHDHVYKRTHMLKDGKVVESHGTVFVGDGCWGRKTRSTEERWYLKSSSAGQHVWSAVLEKDKISLQASGKDGLIFDEFQIDTINKVVVETEWFLRGLPRSVQNLLAAN